MIGTALKQLGRATYQYLAFQAMRAFGGNKSRQPITEENFPGYQPVGRFNWQLLSEKDGHIYEGGPSLTVLDLMVKEPKFILDAGCSNGDFAASVKQRYPQAKIWGVEPNESAARIAAQRIDRVLSQKIEEVDWRREGVARGEIDTVFLMDVLEHIYDPWHTLLAIRNLVSPEAQIIVSMPNVRNVLLMQDLISGYWRYRTVGILDITHIRFFTQQDMLRMFYQTGFRPVRVGSTRCPASEEIFEKHRNGQFPQTIQLKSATIAAQSIEDLGNLCAVQHAFCLLPVGYDQLLPHERDFLIAPHPHTVAFGSD
jgi:2-polyprenyl-3-methyl-5-hydroxy-6-metoxy-1,4-benzoquinol methylase